MAHYQIPLIDESNPFYCPNVSPKSYLATLHKSLSRSDVFKASISLYSFARILDQTFSDVDEELECYSPNDYHDHRYADTRSPKSGSVSSLPAYSPPSWERHRMPVYPPGLVSRNNRHVSVSLNPASPNSTHVLKRKRSTSSNTFSDLEGPTKRERSFESAHSGSFDLSGKAERLFEASLRKGSPAFGSKHAHTGLVPARTTDTDSRINENESGLLARIYTLQGI